MQRITPDEAASLVRTGDTLLISGSGAGHAVPEALLAAVGQRFRNEQQPRDLTSISVVGIGDRISLEGERTGTVTEIKLRVTLLRNDSGDVIVVPNSELFGRPVTVHAPVRETEAKPAPPE